MQYPKIYFFTCPEPDNYQDDIIPLAEGLQASGISFYALNDYWLQSAQPGDYLFKATPDIHFSECDIVIFPYTWFNWVTLNNLPVRKEFPKDLFVSGRKYKTVYFDFNDGYKTVSWAEEFRKFDYIFRCKYNRRMYHPDNMIPWALGFSNRVVKMLLPTPAAQSKKYEVLSNFGASHPYEHQLRRKMRLGYLPSLEKKLKVNSVTDDLSKPPSDAYDKVMWLQTNRRHSAAYYQRLQSHLISLCFCGDLIPSHPFKAETILRHGNKGKLKFKIFEHLDAFIPGSRPRIVQWDSWRFWESLVAGCVPVHIDLEKAGVILPVLPHNKIHYLAVDLKDYNESIDFMAEEEEKVKKIAVAGRQWAMENYAPTAVATRFLKTLHYDI